MSEEIENEVEVEVPDTDAERQAEIRKLLDDMAAGNAKEVQDRFDDLLGAKINADLEQRKHELAQNIFNNPDMQAMGLADGKENVMGAEWVEDESEEESESEETSGEEDEDV